MQMFSIRSLALALLLLLTATGVNAGQERDQLIEQAIAATQAERTGQLIGVSFERSVAMAPQFAQLEGRVRDRMVEVFRQAFAPQRYVQGVRTLLSERLTDEGLRSYIAAMQTPLCIKAQQFELASSLAEPEQVQEFARLSSKELDYDERLALVNRLDVSSGSSEMMLAVTMHTILSSTEMIRRLDALRGGPLSPDGQRNEQRRARVSKAEFAQIVNSVRPRVKRESAQTMLFVYQPLSLAELTQYAMLSEQPAMRSVALAMNDALGTLFLMAQREMFEKLMLEMQGKGERAI
jgi:hypothetical protein